MHSKNKAPLTPAERDHVGLVKELSCAVCDASGPSEAHEIEQGEWFLSIPLCADCHRNPQNGLHGAKVMWRVMKKTELSCLNDTIRRLTA
jgi:hypothetical protein